LSLRLTSDAFIYGLQAPSSSPLYPSIRAFFCQILSRFTKNKFGGRFQLDPHDTQQQPCIYYMLANLFSQNSTHVYSKHNDFLLLENRNINGSRFSMDYIATSKQKTRHACTWLQIIRQDN
jgi:hypothetical protein